MGENGFKTFMRAPEQIDFRMRGAISEKALTDEDYIIPAEVESALASLPPNSNVRFLMSSMGGDVDAAFQIVNRCRELKERGQIRSVETVAEGAVGSAATLVFLLGSSRTMRTGTRFMIHDPYTINFGPVTIEAHESAAERLRKRRDEVAEIYAGYTKQDVSEVLEAMAATTYYTPAEAVQLGYATQSVTQLAIAACGYLTDNAPQELLEQRDTAAAEAETANKARLAQLGALRLDLETAGANGPGESS